MRTKLPYNEPIDEDLGVHELNILDAIDLASSSKNWDRRRRGETAVYATAVLERAAMHLIEDQMSEGRTYWPGAVNAVHLLRKSIEAIEAAEVSKQRAGRTTASWLPKSVLARKMRDGISDA